MFTIADLIQIGVLVLVLLALIYQVANQRSETHQKEERSVNNLTMTSPEQLAILRQGVEVWNQWRKENPDAEIDLEQADLRGADLRLANFKQANLRQARLSNADLRTARLVQADLRGADLMEADLRGADLNGVDIKEADIGGADFRGVPLNDLYIPGTIVAFRWRQAEFDPEWFAVGGKRDFMPPQIRPMEDQLNKLKPISQTSGRALAEAGNTPLKLEFMTEVARTDTPKLQPNEIKERDLLNHVYFAVTSLPAVPAGSSFQLAFWMHLDRQRQKMIRFAQEELDNKKVKVSSEGPVEVEYGTGLTVEVSIDGMKIDPPVKNIIWLGKISKAGFLVSVPQHARSGLHAGMVTVSFERMQIAQISFIFEIGDTAASVRPLPITVQLVRKAFASYASQDRAKVLRLVQGMKKILPELDVFVDVMSLRSGDDWEKKLWAVIEKCDLFYLFWSVHAMRSEWVDKEWRYAWQKLGPERIEPVPLVSPKKAPPPPELASKHFNDPILPYILAEERADRAAQKKR